MNHGIDMFTYNNSIAAFAGTFFCLIADSASSGMDFIPLWIKELGLPVAFCALLAWALVSVFRVNQALHKEAKDTANESVKIFMATTRELVDATKEWSTQIEKLTDYIKNRPCQMQNPNFLRRNE